jgi:hypothetical protein
VGLVAEERKDSEEQEDSDRLLKLLSPLSLQLAVV